MKQVTINLYSFGELSKEAKETAIVGQQIFLNEVDPKGRNYSKKNAVESIEINEYLYYKDGKIAHCTTYTGKHEKSGITEFHFHGHTYDITTEIQTIPRSVAFSIANRFYGSDYPLQWAQFDNAAKELGY